MDEATKLKLVCEMTGENDQDIVKAYLAMAEAKVAKAAMPYADEPEMPARYADVQVDLAVMALNKRGAEGQASHSENGVSRAWEGEGTVLARVVPLCGVPA